MSPRLLAALALIATGCGTDPPAYPPPIQRSAANTARPLAYRHFLAMNDPGAERFFVRDVSPALENNAWRWSGERPTFRFVLQKTEGLRFVMDFSVVGAILEKTGPQAISFFINDRLLGRARYASHGEQHFEKAVDPSWVKPGEETIVAAEIRPVWESPNGVKLGVILLRVGFVE
jgi:hypothetical protein